MPHITNIRQLIVGCPSFSLGQWSKKYSFSPGYGECYAHNVSVIDICKVRSLEGNDFRRGMCITGQYGKKTIYGPSVNLSMMSVVCESKWHSLFSVVPGDQKPSPCSAVSPLMEKGLRSVQSVLVGPAPVCLLL